MGSEGINKISNNDLNTAVDHHRAGRLREAEEIYRRILQADPGHAEALGLLGAIAFAAGHNEQALELISQAIAAKPDYGDAHANLGTVLLAMERSEEALESLDKAIALNPGHAEAFNNKGAALKALGRFDEASVCYRKAIDLRPDSAEVHYNLGNVFNKLERLDEALASFQKAIDLRPEYAEAHNNLGNLYRDMNRMDEAVTTYQTCIATNPDYAEAYSNLGLAEQAFGRLDEAVASYHKALALNPNFAEAYGNLGLAHQVMGRLEEAVGSYQLALAIEPDLSEAHHNLGFALLGMGRQEEGLNEFEWRWRVSSCTSPGRDFPQPQWDKGDTLDGKSILVWPEQGPQDVTIWASAIAELAARAEGCIVETYPKLVPLFARSFPEAEIRLDSAGADDFDVHLPMGSLFRALDTAPTSTVPAFLVPDPDRIAFWKQRLADLGPGPTVGISWKSPVVNSDRSPNYTRLKEWAPLFALPAQFINLQCGDTVEDLAWAEQEPGVTVHDFDDIDLFDDLDDVAALSAALDLSISVSTAVAAITAGVGTPTWVIAWRQSPWNNFLLAPRGPEVTRFERDTGESWDAVFAAMAGQLRDLTG